MRMSQLPVLFFVILCSLTGYSQCVDTTIFPVDNPLCHPDFEPVCGCDGTTYHNSCFALLKGGLFQNAWQFGPCGTIAVNHYPNPYDGLSQFYIEVINRYEDDINIEIKDMNGLLYLQDHYSGLSELQVVYNFSGFPRGLYFLFVYNSTEFEVRKLMIWTP